LKAGMNKHIAKPFDTEELLNLMKNILNA
jgi:DNA-binding response OmpR family regulator